MTTAIILYGSRARGEMREGADVDLIAADPDGSIRKPRDINGVSLHFYPQPWLIEEARSGNLFVNHVAFEGVALLDPDHFLRTLQSEFRVRSSYRSDVELADRVARAVLHSDWGFDASIRRRYFWAIRTILISRTADDGKPIFGSKELEKFSEIKGLARHIDDRSMASFKSCRDFGQVILDRFGIATKGLDQRAILDWLESSSSLGKDTIRLLETKEATEAEGLRFYL